MLKITHVIIVSVLFFSNSLHAQSNKTEIMQSLDKSSKAYGKLAMEIWDLAELGHQEFKSSEKLQSTLKKAGFTIEAGVAGMPTAFVATYGKGKPVIGVLAEFDALPGLSQAAVPERSPIVEGGSGHACGHHLLGVGAIAGAIAAKKWLTNTKQSGTIKVFGAPAEEGGGAKVYMVREGLFKGVDVALDWHPSSSNNASPKMRLANISSKVRFYGKSAHAAGAPDQGRSALDAVEAMNFMMNLMREHISPESRIHYIITKGGDAPNIVPNFAEAYYYVRHPNPEQVKDLFKRQLLAAEAAALGTETRMEYEILNGTFNMLSNHAIGRIIDTNLRLVGGYEYTAEEKSFAEKILPTLAKPGKIGSQKNIRPWKPRKKAGGSSDVSDVSWAVPTATFGAATWVPGTPSHSWQAVAAGGTSMATKGMIMAAKTFALTIVDIIENPSVIEKANEEHVKAKGDVIYAPLLGDRKPPLDYRK